MSNQLNWIVILLAAVAMSFTTSNDKPAYIIYNKKGKQVTYEKMLKSIQKSDMLFFGELHNNPIAHWLQIEVTKDLLDAKKENLVLGAEMFETDNQLLLDEYLNDLISKKNFKKEARLWNNYDTDYEPLVELAKSNNLRFVATNIPRRYASMVFKKGMPSLENLSDEAKQFIAPLPIKVDLELDCYKTMMDMMGGHGGSNGVNFAHAQAVKDATMAHFMLQNWKKGQTFIHYNGAFHSDHQEGIIWYVKQEQPKLNIQNITVVEQEDISSLSDENATKADFIIVVPSNMTKTY